MKILQNRNCKQHPSYRTNSAPTGGKQTTTESVLTRTAPIAASPTPSTRIPTPRQITTYRITHQTATTVPDDGSTWVPTQTSLTENDTTQHLPPMEENNSNFCVKKSQPSPTTQREKQTTKARIRPQAVPMEELWLRTK